MGRTRRSLGAGIGAAAAALLLACGGGGEPGAEARTGGAAIRFPSWDGIPNVFRQDVARNTSDPEAVVFNNTLYVYTSSDLAMPEDVAPLRGGDGNIYPMDTTYVHRLSPNADPADPARWTTTDVLHESNYPMAGRGGGWVDPYTWHLWAPGIASLGGKYVLMVPDVAYGDITRSRIGVSTSSSPTSGFAYQGVFNITGYASDPGLASDPDGNSYLVWANGDYGSGSIGCGGLSIGKLDPSNPLNVLDQREIEITGIPGPKIDVCAGKNRNYLEGPSLYYWGSRSATPAPNAEAGDGPWYLVFAVNDGVPKIAYARSRDLQAWVYQGELMNTDPAGTAHELTNQASIVKWGGDWLMFYHDGPPGVEVAHKRQVHAECVTFDRTGRIVGMDYNNGQPTSAPLLRTDVGLQCARRWPVTVSLSASAGATIADGSNPAKTCTGGIGICRWSYPRNPNAMAYWLYGRCPGGRTPTWTGCDNISGVTGAANSCAFSLAAPRSVRMTCP